MRGVGDELAQLRLAAGAALHAVFNRVDHRVQGPRDVRDLDGAGGGLLADAGQLLGVVGQVASRDVSGCRTNHAERAQLAAHPRAAGEARRDSDNEGQAHLDRDKHHDHVIDAVHLHADEDRLALDDLGGRPERAQLFEAHGMRGTIRRHGGQDLQRGLIQVGHREVRDDRSRRFPVLAHVLEGALGDAGTAKPGPRGTAGDNRPTGHNRPTRTRRTPTRLRDRAGTSIVRIVVGTIVRVHLRVRRIIDIQMLTRALGEAMQLRVHVAEHPGAHHQGGRGDHDDEREGDARSQSARQAPGEGTPPRHWGSRMM